MRNIAIISLVLLICVSTSVARDLIVGTTFNHRLIWHEKAEYMAIPFKKRVKEVFYSDPSQQIIKGIVARDLEQVDETYATITAGGLGFTYVNLRLKSKRGYGLNFQIEVYA